MSPELVLHVLVAQGFEVGGQRAVQQQEAPVQRPHPGDVRRRHRAARGPGAADRACALGPGSPVPCAGRKWACDLLPGLVRPEIRTFRKRSYDGGRGTGAAAGCLSGRGVEPGRSRRKGNVRMREDANYTIGLSQWSLHSHTPSSFTLIFLSAPLRKA